MPHVLVCLDLDGTTLSTDGSVDENAFSRFQACMTSLEGTIAILTARPITDVAELFSFSDSELEVWASDGACRGTVAQGEIIRVAAETSLGREQAKLALQSLEASSHEVLLFSTSENSFEVECCSYDSPSRSAAHLARIGDRRPMRALATFEDAFASADSRKLRAISILDDTSRVAATFATLTKYASLQYLLYREERVRSLGLSWLDILPPSVSKGDAVRAMRVDGNFSTIICAGNGKNDISMFEASDVGFCPSGSDPAVIELAHTKPRSHCGAQFVTDLEVMVQSYLRASE